MKTKLRVFVTVICAVASVVVGRAQTRVNITQLPGSEINSTAALNVRNRPGSPTEAQTLPNSEERKHIYFLYNVGTGEVLHSGGSYGTSAVLSDVGHYLWIENVTTDSVSVVGGQYYIHDNLNTATDLTSFNGYIRLDGVKDENGLLTNPQHVWADNNRSQSNSGWDIQKVTTDNTSDNVYLIYTTGANGTRYYLGAGDYTNNNTSNSSRNLYSGHYVGWSTRSTTQQQSLDLLNSNMNNYWWKFISLEEYATLFSATPAQMNMPLDASFLFMDPSFHVNNRYLTSWTASEGSGFHFGTEYLYKSADKSSKFNMSSNEYENYYKYNSLGNRSNDANSNNVQDYYGPFYYAYTHSSAAQTLSQRIEVARPGWYIIRCNGFSTENYGGEGITKNVATLFAEVNGQRTAQALNGISASESAELMAPPSNYANTRDGSGKLYYEGVKAGTEFAAGKYVNVVMFKVDQASDTNPVWITFGINIAAPQNTTPSAKPSMRRAETTSSSDTWTAFDNFRLFYAGNTTTPDLVLNEEWEDGLDVLANTSDNYTHATLHLNRTFTLGKWNTIVLPVDLNAGQLRTTFGDDVQLAYLKNLTANSMQFERVDLPTSDTGDGLKAYQPYIIKPSKGPGTTPAYTSSALTSTNGDYNGKTLSVPANHYDISMVTLDNNMLGRINTASTDVKVNHTTWETVWTGDGQQSTTYDNRYISAIGTMAKTYSQSGTQGTINTNRDDLSGAYYMSGGEMWRVPEGKKYGMKAFRVWFRPTTVTDPTPAKLTAYLDNEELEVHDNGTATGIDGITFTEPKGVKTDGQTAADGVYTVTGQRVRSGLSTEGLPEGLYIVAGKKVMVK